MNMSVKQSTPVAPERWRTRLVRRWPFLSSLRTRLILLVLLAVLPSLGLVIYNAVEQRRLGVETARKDTLRMVRMAAEHQDEMIEGARQLLVILAQLKEIQNQEKEACRSIFRNLLHRQKVYANIGAIGLDGGVWASAVPSPDDVNLADRSYFLEAIARREFAIGEYQIGRITRKATLNLGYPVMNSQGAIQTVVFVALELDWLERLATRANLPPGSSLTVLDRNRITLARYPDPDRRFLGQQIPLLPSPKRPPAQLMASADGEGTIQFPGRDGIWRLYAFASLGRKLEPTPLRVAIGIPLSVAYGSANRMLARNLACLAVVGGLALLAAWYGGNIFVLNRVRALLRATERLSQGDLQARTGPAPGSGELHQLARAFNTMADSLEKRVAERERAQAALKALNEQLEERVTERTLELRRSNEDLEQFAYVASHDLQEPLRMVTSYLQLLRKRYETKLDADANDFIGFAVDGAERMQRLILDLLAYSRVGTRAKAFEATDSNAVLQDALMNLQVTLRESGAVVTQSALPTVWSDPVQLTQLFQNLVGNGIKFRGEKPPSVRIEAKREDNHWHFTVADNGIGIAPKDFERIFVIFQRLHGRQRYPGTGIGLAICKKIVERHGGRIWVESEPGHGATFHFTIPIAKDHATESPGDPALPATQASDPVRPTL